MGVNEKAKNFINGFFERFEVGTVNFMVKRWYLWNLKYKYAVKTDAISPNYKKEVLQYWSQYTNSFKPYWHKYYSSRNGIYDVRYIPDDLYYTVIDQYFNNRKYGWGVNDKNYYSLWFSDVKQPTVVIRKINNIFYDRDYEILSLEKVLNICLEYKKLIIKPTVETGGSKGIKFWDEKDGIDEIKKHLISNGENLIVQDIIVQHESLSEIHSSSINTVRVISLLFKGEVHILSSVLRMGVNGSFVDNASAGGITCGIEDSGRLKDIAFSAHGKKYLQHPQGFVFSECTVPSFDKVKSLVQKMHIKMAHFRLISWDIAIGQDEEPILIEANLRNGELDFHQFNNGPLFGEITDEVLEEVFGKR